MNKKVTKENNMSKILEQGLIDGIFNKRGVYLSTGGQGEKILADQYSFYANKRMLKYPNTAKILKEISKMWRSESNRELNEERLSF